MRVNLYVDNVKIGKISFTTTILLLKEIKKNRWYKKDYSLIMSGVPIRAYHGDMNGGSRISIFVEKN